MEMENHFFSRKDEAGREEEGRERESKRMSFWCRLHRQTVRFNPYEVHSCMNISKYDANGNRAKRFK